MRVPLPDSHACLRLGTVATVTVFLVACQSANTGETTSAIPALESAAAVEAAPPAIEGNDEAVDGGVSANDEAVPVSAGAEPAVVEPSAQSESDRLRTAVVQIAGLEKEQGRDAAFRSVLACYERAKSREAPVVVAKECATQDFVISRGRQEAGGQRDQQLIIAERAPQRIGALMELKGMGQAEFNNFGLFLNRVALPAYKQARI